MSKQSIWEWPGLESAHQRTTKRELLQKIEGEFNAEIDSLISDRNAYFVFRNTGKWREGYELHYDIKFSLIRNEDLDQNIECVEDLKEETTVEEDVAAALTYLAGVRTSPDSEAAGERLFQALRKLQKKD